MANKMTQKDFFNEIIALAKANDRADIVEFAESRIALLDKKGGKTSAKRTAEVEANETLVFEALSAVNKPITVSELVKTATNEVKDMSGQKVSAYLKKLIENGRVVKTTDKKTSFFQVVAE